MANVEGAGAPVCDEQEVRECMEQWQLPHTMYADAKGYLELLKRGSYYAKAIMLPYSWPGPEGLKSGLLVAVSTAESTTVFNEQLASNRAGQSCIEPEWAKYVEYWYQDLSLFNFAGIRQERHQGTEIGMFSAVLDVPCPRARIENWRIFGHQETL